MNLEPNMKEAVIRRTVRNYASHRLVGAAVEMDRTGKFPRDVAEEMGRLNYFGLEIPSWYGGAGLDTVCYSIVIEEISRANAAMGLCISVHNSVAASPVYLFGDDYQKERFLRPLASGEKIGTFCLTEPNAGSDASSLETTAVRTGDEYVLNGNKVFVTNGGVSGTNLIFAVSHDDKGGKKFNVFVVDSPRSGLKKGPAEDLMGMRGNPVCPISLSDCRIPKENRLGEDGDGLRIAMTTLNGGRIGIGAQALGIAQASLDVSIAYAKERHQFGRPIADFGAIQNFLADLSTKIEAARLLIQRAAYLRDKGGEHAKESAMAKVFASETAVEAAKMGVQVHGGYGYTKSYPIERYYRDAKVCEIYEGTSEVQRIVIARSLFTK
jgi:butyryl-CoA dehydrogenase